MSVEFQGLSLPSDGEEPVFAAPWEARIFAIVLQLHQKHHYDWSEWVGYLTQEIDWARQVGQTNQPYYEQWLAACERLLTAKGFVDSRSLSERVAELAELQQQDHDHPPDSLGVEGRGNS